MFEADDTVLGRHVAVKVRTPGYVNDEQVVSATDPTYTDGRLWLSVGTFGGSPDPAEARFDNVAVTPLTDA